MAASEKIYTQVISFDSQKAWETWLSLNHRRSEGIWLQFYKKTSGKQTFTHSEALDGALCYGWIDGQLKPYDAESWLHKFTPRRARSTWSKRNTERAEQLITTGKMKRAGMKEVDAAKATGRWQRAYDSPRNMSVPPDFLRALSKDKKAKAFFKTLNRANIYAIAWRLQTAARPETRKKRRQEILAMLARETAFHPQRPLPSSKPG
jgi:uncharacterized protein YdeI (YjbR/CyaY-like superfamily)